MGGLKKAPIFEFFPSKTCKFDEIHAKKKNFEFLLPKGRKFVNKTAIKVEIPCKFDGWA
jgi:hypothetical protein